MHVTVTVPDPLRVAEDTYLIRPLIETPGTSGAMHVSSLVIQGAEPVLIDTSAGLVRDAWLEQVFALVEPEDVRWILLSHDDPDHNGNLCVALEMCPNATLVTSTMESERLACSPDTVVDRRPRWIGDGETLTIADRRLIAIRPPVFDAPSTRGFLDTSTGVYWSSDAFGTPVSEVVDEADELPPDELDSCSTAYASILSPWHTVVDGAKFGGWVDRVADLQPKVIVGAHGPVLSGQAIGDALSRLRRLPDLAAAAPPTGPGLVEMMTATLLR